MVIPSPPFFLIYFLFPFSPLQSSILHPPSSILSLPLSPIPYPPILSSFPSIFLLPSISPFSTPHSSLFTSTSSSSSSSSPTTTTGPPFPFFLPPLSPFFFLSHTHTTHATQYLYNLFFFIKEYGTFSIHTPQLGS